MNKFLASLLPATAFCLLLPSSCSAQLAPENVTIHVHADQTAGALRPIWNYFGYDEPNYTYAPNGKKLLGELSALSPVPVYVRVHNLLTTGDGSASCPKRSPRIPNRIATIFQKIRSVRSIPVGPTRRAITPNGPSSFFNLRA